MEGTFNNPRKNLCDEVIEVEDLYKQSKKSHIYNNTQNPRYKEIDITL